MAVGGVCSGDGLSGHRRGWSGGGRRLAKAATACWLALSALAGSAVAQTPEKFFSVTGNPASTDYSVVGTGWLGRTLGLKDEWGVKLGGLWLADTNIIMAGGEQPGGWTNKQAGSVAGFNGIVGASPFNRTELLEAWYLQEMVKDVLRMRIGRSLPTYDFGNVLRPVAVSDPDQNIPAVSSLLWSPIFLNASMITAFMGYYNPANGVTVNFTPTKSFYVNLGVYDGNRARGVQTGVSPPMFNGYWFNIGEVGVNWLLGEGNHPGQFGVGLWRQTGVLSRHGISEDGTGGFYLFGSQRVAHSVNPSVKTSSISVFYQVGANDSQTMPMTQYYSAGVTGFALIGNRQMDSMGIGAGLTKLNPNFFQRQYELMFQAYYQAHLFSARFLQPTVTYIPTPGASPTLPGALAGTLRLTVLF